MRGPGLVLSASGVAKLTFGLMSGEFTKSSTQSLERCFDTTGNIIGSTSKTWLGDDKGTVLVAYHVNSHAKIKVTDE